MNQPCIVLTTGGTGGHIFPALAVAEALRAECPAMRIVFMGSERGPEGRLAEVAGLEFVGLPVRGVLGRGMKAAGALWQMGRSVMLARGVLQRLQPGVVAGFGAYASAPALVAAKLLGVPLALHEQNAVPGMVNRLLASSAKRVFLSLPDRVGRFPAEKAVVTGNPIRAEIARLGQSGTVPCGTSGRRLLIMGGSQGARAINSVVLGGLSRLAAAGVELRHQAGPADVERVLAGYRGHGLETSGVSAFIDDMAGAYAWADLVLCRSGASTVAELAAAGKPALLIPFPHATHDHQTANARVLADAGAAVLLAESELPGVDALGQVLALLDDPASLARMGAAARREARVDAANRVAAGLLAISQEPLIKS